MDPNVILASLLKGRRKEVRVGERMIFTIVRPTEMDIIRARNAVGEVEIGLKMLQDKVVGWDKVLESDILPGGANDPVAFDSILYAQWIADRPDLWPPLFAAFQEAIEARSKELGAVSGN